MKLKGIFYIVLLGVTASFQAQAIELSAIETVGLEIARKRWIQIHGKSDISKKCRYTNVQWSPTKVAKPRFDEDRNPIASWGGDTEIGYLYRFIFFCPPGRPREPIGTISVSVSDIIGSISQGNETLPR